MKLLKAFVMSFSMFTSIPCPMLWDEDARPWMLPALALVGGIVGGLWYALTLLMDLIALPAPLYAALLCAFPYLITGFIHLDGFMDTSDALLSRRPREDMLRILKDSHVGAFSVIAFVLVVLLSYGAAVSAVAKGADFRMLVCVPFVTRACAAVAVLSVRPLNHSEYGGDFSRKINTAQRVTSCVFLAVGMAAAYLFFGVYALATSAVAILGYVLSAADAGFKLGGMSGDVSGFALVMGEAASLIAIALI